MLVVIALKVGALGDAGAIVERTRVRIALFVHECRPSILLEPAMSLTAEHLQIASNIDQAMKGIIANDGDDVANIRDMLEYMSVVMSTVLPRRRV